MKKILLVLGSIALVSMSSSVDAQPRCETTGCKTKCAPKVQCPPTFVTVEDDDARCETETVKEMTDVISYECDTEKVTVDVPVKRAVVRQVPKCTTVNRAVVGKREHCYKLQPVSCSKPCEVKKEKCPPKQKKHCKPRCERGGERISSGEKNRENEQ